MFNPLLAATLLVTAPLAAQTQGEAPKVQGEALKAQSEAPKVQGEAPKAQADTHDLPLQLPGLFLYDTAETAKASWRWASEDWSHLALGGVALIGTALLLDRPVQRAVQRNESRTLTRWSSNFEPIGNKYSFVAAGGFYVFGLVAKDAEARATGADTLTALAIAGLALVPLKYGLGRARPEDQLGARSIKPFSGQDSFPSAHTTFAFTAAAAITEHYPQPWVQATAYGLATLTGLSRIQQNFHWTSDVLAGALLGVTLGKVVTRMNQRLRFGKQARVRFQVAPDLGPGYQGLRLGLTF